MRSWTQDLKTVGLSSSATPSPGAIKKAYYKAAMKMHPDKPGGSTEAFQDLQNAFERLRKGESSYSNARSAAAAPAASAQTARKREEAEAQERGGGTQWNDEYYNDSSWRENDSEYFGRSTEQESHEEYMRRCRKKAAKQRAKNVKSGYDFRDEKPSSDGDESASGGLRKSCHFCKTNATITPERALNSGLKWEEYVSHPKVKSGEYGTCWACKNSHDTVMTENMAASKFAKTLDPKIDGQYGPYRKWAYILRQQKRSFSHKPRENARKSVYYWVPDLEELAKARGWKPRKKRAKKTNGNAQGPYKKKKKSNGARWYRASC